jgi:type I restriction enzyme, S subunit
MSIPKGWEDKNLGEVATLQRGFDLPEQDRVPGVIPIVSSSGTTGFHNEWKVNPPGIVTGRYGTIGEVFFIEVDFWPLNTSLWVKDFHGNNHRYVYYLLKSLDYKKLSDKTGVPGINRNDVHKLKVILPPLREQCRIAEILGVWDESIDLLERLIGRIRSRKQGLMQQLLTGKKRFKEFEGSEWKLQTLSDFGKNGCPTVKAGPFGSSLKKEFYTDRGYKIYGQEQVIADSPFIGNYYIDESRFQSLKSCEVLPDDILVTLVGTIGRVLLLPKDIEAGIINPRLLRIRLDKQKIVPSFAKHYLESESNIKLMESLSQGGTMGVLNAKLFKSLPFPYLSITEQEKIAAVLSAADAEISTLEKQLAAYKQQKRGLMQQLLTGRTSILGLEDGQD